MDPLERRGEAAPTDPKKDERGRDSLFLLAKLRQSGSDEVVPVRVRNLSAVGLMADLSEPLDLDAAVEVEVRGLGWIPGRIAWHTEGRTGIAFDRPVDPRRARKPVSAPETPPFGRR